MKITKAKRKLVPQSTLNIIQEKLDLGVPLAKITRDLGLDISRTHIAKLLKFYTLIDRDPTVASSLFPKWLDGKVVQENPDGWVYVGFFPWGSWVYVEDTEAVH